MRVSLLPDAVRREASCFRGEFYEYLTTWRDELFQLMDAVLCADGAVKSPVDLTLLPGHHRGHGTMYGGSTMAGSIWIGCGLCEHTVELTSA